MLVCSREVPACAIRDARVVLGGDAHIWDATHVHSVHYLREVLTATIQRPAHTGFAPPPRRGARSAFIYTLEGTIPCNSCG